MEIWESQPPGTHRPCPGLYRDCFIIYLLLKMEILKPLKNTSWSNRVKIPAIEITMNSRTNAKYFEEAGFVIVIRHSRNMTTVVKEKYLKIPHRTVKLMQSVQAPIAMKCTEQSVLMKTRRTDGGVSDSRRSVYECCPCL